MPIYGSLILLLCLSTSVESKIKSKLKFGKKKGGDEPWRSEAMTAVRDGKTAVINKLYSVEHPDEINNPCCSGMSPLQFACKVGSVKATRALIELGADLGAAHEGTKTTPLMFAAREGSIDALRTLLFANSDKTSPLEKFEVRTEWDYTKLDAKDEHGNTALLLSANAGHEEAADLLLTAGCDSLVLNDNGNNMWQVSLRNVLCGRQDDRS
jgi:ankyrin repeat protein